MKLSSKLRKVVAQAEDRPTVELQVQTVHQWQENAEELERRIGRIHRVVSGMNCKAWKGDDDVPQIGFPPDVGSFVRCHMRDGHEGCYHFDPVHGTAWAVD